MLKRHASAWRFPYYVWILAVYPILYLYSVNFGLVRDREAAATIIGMLALATIAYWLAGRVIREQHKRAFYLCLASLAFSLSGHVYLIAFMPKSLLVWNLLSGAGLIALCLGIHRLIKRPEDYAKLTSPFNLIALILLTAQILTLVSQIAAAQENASIFSAYSSAESITPSQNKVMDSVSRPDIYYIIPDAYPSDEWLMSAMNYDNSEFTEALRERGFVIAPHAQSNYATTMLSLPSVLNMRYIDENPSDYGDSDYLHLSTANSEVARKLLRLGYTYVQFLSGFLYPSPIADIIRDFTSDGPVDITVNESLAAGNMMTDRRQVSRVYLNDLLFRQPFLPVYIDTTALRIVRSQLQKIAPPSQSNTLDRLSAERFLATIDEIETIVAMPEATFTLVHLLKPHYPVHFNADGDIIGQINRPSPEEYFADFRYANSQFLRLVDTILEGSSHQPIIIFQADHGSSLGYARSEDKRLVLFDVYAAYYLPDVYDIEFPGTYTTINTYPLIFNEVFGTDYELRENRLMEVIEYKHLFVQQDVSDAFLRAR